MYVRVGLAMLIAAVMLTQGSAAYGQTAKKGASKGAVAQFEAKFAEWKKVVAELRQNTLEIQAAKASDREKLVEARKEIVARGQEMEPSMKRLAEAAYVAAPNKNKDATEFVAAMAAEAERYERYEEALRLCSILIDNGYENKAAYVVGGRSAFNCNEFDTAAKYLKIAQDAKILEESPGGTMLATVEDFQKRWNREQELRDAEERANDLPRVKLTTSKGDIVVELFENEAPNTVANFISLVEQGKYNDTPFHRVIKGFVAQGGDPKGDGTGGPGYTIACECFRDDHREHFRGSLSMAHSGKDTGGSQFFLTFTPTQHLDGRHTVFGRIIDGMDVLAELQRRDPNNPPMPDPDRIISATVVRKRKHPYEPVRVTKKPTEKS